MVKVIMRMVLCFLSLACLSCVASCSPSASCAGTKTPFCGSACRCSAEDDLKLHQAFLAEVKAHGYHDAECRSQLKAYLCAVCLPSSPAEPFRKTITRKNDKSSLSLRRAALSVSIHDLTSPSTEPPTPEWLLADDDNKAATTPKLLIGLIVSVLTLLGAGGFITYKIHKGKLECCNNNQCCTNTKCCLCLPE